MADKHTSPLVSSWAGEFLAEDDLGRIHFAVNRPSHLIAIVASALTQAHDKVQPVDTTAGDREIIGDGT